MFARCPRVYLEESLRTSGAVSDALEEDLGDLQKALGLGVREAEDIRSEIVSRAYKCVSLRKTPLDAGACMTHAPVLWHGMPAGWLAACC